MDEGEKSVKIYFSAIIVLSGYEKVKEKLLNFFCKKIKY